MMTTCIPHTNLSMAYQNSNITIQYLINAPHVFNQNKRKRPQVQIQQERPHDHTKDYPSTSHSVAYDRRISLAAQTTKAQMERPVGYLSLITSHDTLSATHVYQKHHQYIGYATFWTYMLQNVQINMFVWIKAANFITTPPFVNSFNKKDTPYDQQEQTHPIKTAQSNAHIALSPTAYDVYYLAPIYQSNSGHTHSITHYEF